jgi:energy-coupling factor transporter ATP-binding protein EcfA2
MINLPLLEELHVTGYGLYPGTENSTGLHIEFRPGATLILGANGLGKSTLVSIIYRLLTGPFDIPGLVGRTDLGNMRLATTALSPLGRKTFAQRVVDGARNAKARLSFKLDQNTVVVERSLSDLALTHFSVNGSDLPKDEEGSFQPEMLRLIGLWSFGDGSCC